MVLLETSLPVENLSTSKESSAIYKELQGKELSYIQTIYLVCIESSATLQVILIVILALLQVTILT